MAKRRRRKPAKRRTLEDYIGGPQPRFGQLLKADPITLKMTRAIASFGATHAEAAARFGVSDDTWLDFRKSNPVIQDAWEQGAKDGLLSLRARQFQLSRTSATMGMFLGVNYLGQKPLYKGGDTNLNVGIGVSNAEPAIEKLLSRIAELRESFAGQGGDGVTIEGRAGSSPEQLAVLGATGPATAEGGVEYVAAAGGPGIRKD